MKFTRRSTGATLRLVLPAVVLAGGVFVGRLQSTEWRWRTPAAVEPRALVALDPVLALPRTAGLLATLEAEQHLAAGRPYAAWESLQGYLDLAGPEGQRANLLAARAASQWGGWDRARSVLAGRTWLTTFSRGEGMFLLARAEEELGNSAGADEAFRAYLTVNEAEAEARAVARARHAGILSGLGLAAESAGAFDAAAADLPAIADWLGLRAREERAKVGDLSVTRSDHELLSGTPTVRMRRALLDAGNHLALGERDAAIARLAEEVRVLEVEDARAEVAQLKLRLAEVHLADGYIGSGRTLLREVAADSRVPADLRVNAAERLGSMTDLTIAEHLARADANEAGARPGLAAASLRAALDAGAPDSGEGRLRLALLLFDARDYGPARAAFLRAAELHDDREARAYAEVYAARSQLRAGGTARARQNARQAALSDLTRIANQFPGTAAAGTALFILGDEASSTASGRGFYRRAAAIEHSPDARESLFRVGDRSLKLKETGAALEAWDEYVRRYPAGEQTARAAYEAGRLHESAGRGSRAREMYAAAMAAEPTSYWAIRAGDHLGAPALATVRAEPRAWIGLASEPAEAAAVLRRLDQLSAAGLREARELEYRAALIAFRDRPVAVLTLAEGLRDRGEILEGIRLGNQLRSERNGYWDERILRLVYPFPFRDLVVAEAERSGVSPTLYAALIRQESTFRPRIKSRVGATGLGQIMPATGQWLAPAVGIRNYDHSLLEVPEVNLRMGTKYLGDLLKRYNGAVDLALAGYNAGPGRADRWRTQFNYGRDTDAFRAAIPFAETRNYVMVVVRNAALYESLYGGREARVLGEVAARR